MNDVLGIEQHKRIEDHWSSVFTSVESMNNSNRRQHKYSTPNHQKISIQHIIDFLKKIFSLV